MANLRNFVKYTRKYGKKACKNHINILIRGNNKPNFSIFSRKCKDVAYNDIIIECFMRSLLLNLSIFLFYCDLNFHANMKEMLGVKSKNLLKFLGHFNP